MNGPVKRLAVLGSTGSIGRQTLDIVRAMPGYFQIVGLGAGHNTGLLAEQIEEFRPRFAWHATGSDSAKKLDTTYTGYELLPLEAMAGHPDVDIAVIATSGQAGLMPTLAALAAGKNVALANKETLVAAGSIVMAAAERSGARLLPVDSEHSAIWQCLNGEVTPARRIILTASGGPFRRYSAKQMAAVTAAQALRHPSWQMGKKVTIDSATLMNKGLEIIEARWLFNMPIDNIKVMIHPRSIIHSMVEFVDGSVKAQLGCPDMRLPIQYALTYPARIDNPGLPRLDWDGLGSLDFEPPDYDRFPCLGLAVAAGKSGGTCPAALCAADEIAVAMFLEGRIKFTEIAGIVGKVLEKHENKDDPTLEDIINADARARETALALAGGEWR